jgi:hypothetical protein
VGAFVQAFDTGIRAWQRLLESSNAFHFFACCDGGLRTCESARVAATRKALCRKHTRGYWLADSGNFAPR